MKKLLSYMRGYKKECFLGPFMKILEATLELLVPYVILDMVNNGINAGNKHYVIIRMIQLILMGLGGLVCTVIAQYFSAKAACGYTSRLREALFFHIQSLSYKQLDSIGKTTLVTRMTSDMNQVQNGLNLTLRLFLRSPFIVFGAMIMAFTIDSSAALVFAVAIPILAAVVFGIMLITIPMYKRVQQHLDKITLKTRENLSGIRILRALGKENSEMNDFEQSNKSLTVSQKSVGRISALLNPLTYVLINIAIACLIYKGAVKVEYGVLTQGAVLALYNYMSQILIELVKLANLIINITKSVACAKRINAVFKIGGPEKRTEKEYNTELSGGSENSDAYEVEFKDVTLCYGGGEAALKNISFKIKKGQFVGVIGGTGSGKTSLVNLIPGFYDATYGDIYIKGQNIKKYSKDELLKFISAVPQKAILFKGTVRSNILFGKKDADENEIKKALEISQSADFVKQCGGLDTYIEQGGGNLSGGQKQRLTVARAVISKPDILILDDSSSALDYATDLAMRKAIAENFAESTVFIVSQRSSTVRGCDVIIVLDEGCIVGCGTHDELIESCPIYREIYESQSRYA